MAALHFRVGETKLGRFYYPLEREIKGFPFQTAGLRPRRGKFEQRSRPLITKPYQLVVTPSLTLKQQLYRKGIPVPPPKQYYKSPKYSLPRLKFRRSPASMRYDELKKNPYRDNLKISAKPRLRLTYYRVSPPWDPFEPREYYSPLWTRTPLHYLSESSASKNFETPLLKYQCSAPRTSTLIKYKDPLEYVAMRGTVRPLPRRRYWLATPVSYSDLCKCTLYSPSKSLCYDDELLKHTDLLRHATLSCMPEARPRKRWIIPKFSRHL